MSGLAIFLAEDNMTGWPSAPGIGEPSYLFLMQAKDRSTPMEDTQTREEEMTTHYKPYMHPTGNLSSGDRYFVRTVPVVL